MSSSKPSASSSKKPRSANKIVTPPSLADSPADSGDSSASSREPSVHWADVGGPYSRKRSIEWASTDEPLDITIGCEFEFMLAHHFNKPKTLFHDVYEDNTGKDIVNDALAEELVAICEVCGKSQKFHLLLGGVDKVYDKWQVTRDATVHLREHEQEILPRAGYEVYSIEVTSRILSWNSKGTKSTCGHPFTYSEEITAVLDRLKERFCGFGDGNDGLTETYLLINETCGFHVHVGSAKGTIPLGTVKKLFAMSLACERQIDRVSSADNWLNLKTRDERQSHSETSADLCIVLGQMHARPRITGFELSDSPHRLPPMGLIRGFQIQPGAHNSPLSMLFMAEADRRRRRDNELYGEEFPAPEESRERGFARLGPRYPESEWHNPAIWEARRRSDVDAWITLVRHASHLNAIQEMQAQRGRRCVLNTSHLPYGNHAHAMSLGTIEFRQHAGTIEPSTVVAFVDFVASLVQYCHTTGDDLFYPSLGVDGDFRRPDFDTVDLCARLGCSEATGYYSERLSDDNGSILKVLDNQINAAKAIKDADPIGKLAFTLLRWERFVTDPVNVDARIMRKLTVGGYGQFHDDTLDALLPEDISDQTRARLRLGYTGGPVELRPDAPVLRDSDFDGPAGLALLDITRCLSTNREDSDSPPHTLDHLHDVALGRAPWPKPRPEEVEAQDRRIADLDAQEQRAISLKAKAAASPFNPVDRGSSASPLTPTHERSSSSERSTKADERPKEMVSSKSQPQQNSGSKSKLPSGEQVPPSRKDSGKKRDRGRK